MPRLSNLVLLSAGVLWIGSVVAAYQAGTHQQEAPSPSTNAPTLSSTKLSGVVERAADFNDTRSRGTENRFLNFASTLGGDQLNRILPEVSDKMTLSQVESTLARLLGEVSPGPGRRTARFELIRRWSQLDPEGALEHITALDDPKMRHDLRLKGIEGWASVDPLHALNYALESDDELLAKSTTAVRQGFATMRNLDAAFAFLPHLASNESPDESWTVTTAVEALYLNDDFAVTLWLERLSAGAVRDQALPAIVAQWARHDPEEADKWVAKHADPEELPRLRKLFPKK